MRGRAGSRFDALDAVLSPVERSEGSSSFFREPTGEHDPRLFEQGTDRVREDIRADLVRALTSFFDQRYAGSGSWLHAWIAGSSLGQQWSRDKDGKGDLDVLIGIDLPKFFTHNRHLRQFPEKVLTDHINGELREELWTEMTDYRGEWEVTFYVNPRTGDDIRRINPYAAYNLFTGEWDVRPDELPEDWSEEHIDQSWWDALDTEIAQAEKTLERYDELVRALEGVPVGPRRSNLLQQLNLVIDQVGAHFGAIRDERRLAFQGLGNTGGGGYRDYYNFRWQMFKRHGLVAAMVAVRDVGRAAETTVLEERYGTPPSADVLTPVTLKDYL